MAVPSPGDLGAENLDLQRFSQPFSIHGLLGKCKADLEGASHLKCAEVGYAFRHLEAWWLRWPLHTAPQQEADAGGLCQENQRGDWRWDTAPLTNRVTRDGTDAEAGSAPRTRKVIHRIYRLRS